MSENNFGKELQKTYEKFLLMQHNLQYDTMIAAFSVAAQNAELLNMPVSSTSLQLMNSDIPREEIECDVEVSVVKQLLQNLEKLDTNLDGFHAKKFGFREVIGMVGNRQPYAPSPRGSSAFKRPRTSLLSLPPTPTSSCEDGNSSKRSRADDTSTTLDESNASSCDGNLVIDLPETNELSCEQKKSADAVKPTEKSKDSTTESSTYKPSKLRIERLKNITKKKPKFNIENLDLTYNPNMARSFPGAENRTSDQIARRARNTIAARVSRKKNSAYENYLAQQSLIATEANIKLKRKIACLRVYASELMKANGFPYTNLNEMWETNIRDILCAEK